MACGSGCGQRGGQLPFPGDNSCFVVDFKDSGKNLEITGRKPLREFQQLE
jgi:hypothetical protein